VDLEGSQTSPASKLREATSGRPLQRASQDLTAFVLWHVLAETGENRRLLGTTIGRDVRRTGDGAVEAISLSFFARS
jgi:hypothetical protein